MASSSPRYNGTSVPGSSPSEPLQVHLVHNRPQPVRDFPASANMDTVSHAEEATLWTGDSPTAVLGSSSLLDGYQSPVPGRRGFVRPDTPTAQYCAAQARVGGLPVRGSILKDTTNLQSERVYKVNQARGGDWTPLHVLRDDTEQDNIFATLDTPQPRTFRPMQTKLGGFQLQPVTGAPAQSQDGVAPESKEAIRKMMAGFSPNYKGNIDLPRNRSADIPASQNCALFIMGLPPRITVTELLATIRDTGRIYATHVNGPEPEKGHGTSAAKLIFFDRAGAQRFFDRCALSGLRIPGYPEYSARVVWNRIRTPAADAALRHHSRVLFIAGPARWVGTLALTAYFQTKFDFDVDEVIDHGGEGGRKLVEYRFGSFRCQAEAAKMTISRELADGGVMAWFGRDPCDVAESEAGVGIMERTAGAGFGVGSGGQENQRPSARDVANWRQGHAARQLR